MAATKMSFPLFIAGSETARETFTASSPFYPDHHHTIASAGPLEVAQAIGAARAADRPGPLERLELLRKAAAAFSFTKSDLEHAVRQTGMPVTLLKALFEEIPEIFHSVARGAEERFLQLGKGGAAFAERLGSGLVSLLEPVEGFCYAITPGVDPRASAIVAANLGCLGIPFVLRPSIRDAAALLVVRSLLAAGFDPRFCSLVYLDREDPHTTRNHFHLLEACSAVWTFGPPAVIDSTLRFEAGHDRFEGKRIIRHPAGNCAAVACGLFSEQTRAWLYDSIGIAPVCTATKSVMATGDSRWAEYAADFLGSLKVGDPLDPETQIGYIDTRCLDYLEDLRRMNSLDIQVYGGERISAIQARPLLVASQASVPDFFAQEIPAYVLAVRACASLSEAVEQINSQKGLVPRLAVAFFAAPDDQLGEALLKVRALTALVNRPTTTLIPVLHEGNDYARLLTQGKLIVLK